MEKPAATKESAQLNKLRKTPKAKLLAKIAALEERAAADQTAAVGLEAQLLAVTTESVCVRIPAT